MDSINYVTFGCTDFDFELTAFQQERPITMIWNIQNLTGNEWNRIIENETICGPNFKFHPLSNELWKLALGPNRDFDNSRASMKIRKVSECKSTGFEFTISWTAYAKQGSMCVTKKVNVPANVSYHELFDLYPSQDDEMSTFMQRYVSEGRNNCNMIIEIDYKPQTGTANSTACQQTSPLQSSLDKCKLAVLADMESILKEAEFADISLRSEGKEIRAHRAILAGRSAVFKSMFQHQMSEKASGSVYISDIPYDTLQLLVTHMYSGRLMDLDVKSASELFVASDKYAVEDLHKTCSQFLKRSLTVENCLEILMLANSHSNKDLKSSAVKYFSQHSKEICQKPDWKNVSKVRPAIAFELLKVIAFKP